MMLMTKKRSNCHKKNNPCSEEKTTLKKSDKIEETKVTTPNDQIKKKLADSKGTRPIMRSEEKRHRENKIIEEKEETEKTSPPKFEKAD